jgi:hypothetical protein
VRQAGHAGDAVAVGGAEAQGRPRALAVDGDVAAILDPFEPRYLAQPVTEAMALAPLLASPRLAFCLPFPPLRSGGRLAG